MSVNNDIIRNELTTNFLNQIFVNSEKKPLGFHSDVYQYILSYLPDKDLFNLALTAKAAVSLNDRLCRITLRGGSIDRKELNECIKKDKNVIFTSVTKLDLSGSLSTDLLPNNRLSAEQFLTYLSVQKVDNVFESRFPHLVRFDFSKKIWDANWVPAFKYLSHLKEINLSSIKKLKNNDFLGIIKHCPDLRILNLNFCYGLSGKFSVVGLKNLESLSFNGSMFALVNVTSVELDSEAKNLKEICFNSCKRLTDFDFLKYASGLEKLSLVVTKNLKNPDLLKIIGYCTSLKSLFIDCSIGLSDEISLMGLKNLEKLSLSGSPHITSLRLDSEMKNLREIEAFGCPELATPDLNGAINLEKLSLSYNLTNNELAEIIMNCPNLIELEIDDCSELTGEVSLAGLKKLKKLSIENCENISSLKLDPEIENLPQFKEVLSQFAK